MHEKRRHTFGLGQLGDGPVEVAIAAFGTTGRRLLKVRIDGSPGCKFADGGKPRSVPAAGDFNRSKSPMQTGGLFLIPPRLGFQRRLYAGVQAAR